jgi:hypothetical protein
MKALLKPVFNLITDGYTLFENDLYNYMAMTVIGVIAFIISWNIVGALYRNDMINGKITGSILHWTIRLITFCVLFFILNIVIGVARFIMTIPLWI